MPSSPHSHEAICSGTSPVPVLEFGIPDFGTPDDANSFASFVKEICEHSKRRQNVLIHCEGGIGRTGMVAQYVLLALSLPKEEAAGGGREQAESGGSKGMLPSSSPLVQTWRWAGFTIEHSTAISGLEESRRQSKDGAAVDEGGREHAVSGPDDAADDALPQGEQEERRADGCHRGRQEGVAEAEDEAGDDAGSEVDVLSLEDVVHVAPEEQLFQQIPGQGKDEDGSHKGRIDHAAPIHEVNPAIEKHEWAEQDGQGHLARLFLDAGCQVWGVDVSTKMLAQARQRLPGVRLVRADLTRRLPEEVRVGFDRIVSTYFFHEFPMTEKVALITRLTDHALNPGGFLVGDVGFPDRKAFELAREHWAREWDEEAFYWVGDEAVRALEQAGFDAVYTQVTVSAGVLVIRPGRPSASD